MTDILLDEVIADFKDSANYLRILPEQKDRRRAELYDKAVRELEYLQKIRKICEEDSLAADGMEMIQSAMRDSA